MGLRCVRKVAEIVCSHVRCNKLVTLINELYGFIQYNNPSLLNSSHRFLSPFLASWVSHHE